MVKPIEFYFDSKTLNIIFDILRNTRRFIKIAIFQIHNKEFFNIINKLLQKGISVEIFTLPYDSIHENIEQVKGYFEEIINNGAQVYFCGWNIGDPERTSTATNIWYSFHGKFLVTDSIAAIFSTNLTNKDELNVLLKFYNDQKYINLFVKKFDELKALFISPGTANIKNKIKSIHYSEDDEIFKLPKSIQNESLSTRWIRHYPISLCKKVDNIPDEGFYITPFDGTARDIYYNVIKNSSEFLYLSTETFTDKDFPHFLQKHKDHIKEIKILTGSSSMDFQNRINESFKDLIASEIIIKSLHIDHHAKVLITESFLIISSINLNKMNLGFYKTKSFWRANTETLFILKNEELINRAKKKFMEIFNQGISIIDILAKKIEMKIGQKFNIYGLKSKSEVKRLFAYFIITTEITQKKLILKIYKMVSKIMSLFNTKLVTKDHFLMALILFYVSENKLKYNQLEEKLKILPCSVDLDKLLDFLIDNQFIERDDEDFYKINIIKLFE
ncbi:MAG: phospholipase D-like domain-containing protein [Promethearchaeota archaeon]